MKKMIQPTILILAAASLVSCATSGVQTKASQASTTPQQALQSLKEGNARFAAGRSRHHDLRAQAEKTSTGQFPIAAVLGCMDSRASNELIFDQGIGDIFSARVAGNVLNNDLLGSLEFATVKAGAKAIVVVGHTRCGAVAGACSRAKLDHLTRLLDKIQPAVSKVSKSSVGMKSRPAFEDEVSAENVRQVVSQIRAQSPLIRKLEKNGKLIIVGGLYHLDTRKVEYLN